DQCPDTGKFNGRNCQWIAVEVGWVYTIVGNMDCLTGLDDTADRGQRTRAIERRPVRPTLEVLRNPWRYAELRDNPGGAILDPIKKTKLGLADALRVRQHRLEHRL